MSKLFFWPSLLCFLIYACGENRVSKEPIDANAAYFNSIKHMTGLEFQPRIQQADSVQVLFYDNPDGDPKRYTRFYTWYPSSEPSVVTFMKSSVAKHFERIEKVKDCRSEGKIHFFAGENPMQTLYFSNRGDTCNHLYFIADGWFFYMPMDSSTALKLKELKTLAYEPPTEIQEQ
jgi:hypothetical protein